MKKTDILQSKRTEESDAVLPRGDTGIPIAGRRLTAFLRHRRKFFFKDYAHTGEMTVKKTRVQDTLTRDTAAG